MIDPFCTHLGKDWLRLRDLEDQKAQDLEEDLKDKQPEWQHGQLVGKGGRAAVISEKP